MQHIPIPRRHAGEFVDARRALATGAMPTLPSPASPTDAIACSHCVADASCVTAGECCR